MKTISIRMVLSGGVLHTNALVQGKAIDEKKLAALVQATADRAGEKLISYTYTPAGKAADPKSAAFRIYNRATSSFGDYRYV